MAVKKKMVDKWKTKKWFTLIAPKIFDLKELMETPAQKESQILNRRIELRLAQLTGQRQQRYVKVKFKVTKVEGLKAFTELDGHEVMKGYINRITRRRKSKIETTKFINSLDNKKIKVTMIVITARKASVKKEKEIRKRIGEFLEKNAVKKNYYEFMNDLLSGSLSSNIFKEVKNIVPIQRVEVIKSQLLKR